MINKLLLNVQTKFAYIYIYIYSFYKCLTVRTSTDAVQMGT